MSKSDFYIVTVEDEVVQITTYIVKAEDEKNARDLISQGIYAFESECEIVDTVKSEIKSVESIK